MASQLVMPLTPATPTGWRRLWSLQGSALPPHLVLLARALGVCVFLREWWHPPGVFLPFFGEAQLDGAATVWAIRLLALVLSLLLVLNRLVAPAAVALGVLLLLQIAGSRVYYANNRTFTALVLVLVGLCAATKLPLVRYQIVLLYLSAATNKLLDADWRSGDYLHSFASTAPTLDRILDIAPAMDKLAAARAMSWTVIALEIALALAFCIPRLFPYAVFTGIAYHTGLVVTAHRTFGLFWYVTAVSYLAFVRWPATPLPVRVDPARAGHRLVRAVLAWFDPDHGLAWSEGPGRMTAGPRARGLLALMTACARLPAFLLGVIGVLALPFAPYNVAMSGVVMLGLVLFAGGFAWRVISHRRELPVGVS